MILQLCITLYTCLLKHTLEVEKPNQSKVAKRALKEFQSIIDQSTNQWKEAKRALEEFDSQFPISSWGQAWSQKWTFARLCVCSISSYIAAFLLLLLLSQSKFGACGVYNCIQSHNSTWLLSHYLQLLLPSRLSPLKVQNHNFIQVSWSKLILMQSVSDCNMSNKWWKVCAGCLLTDGFQYPALFEWPERDIW